MRFIGNKESLLDRIHSAVLSTGQTEGTFCDFFAGTGSVGRYFKQQGYRVISSDLLYFSYVLQRAYIQNNSEPDFARLLPHLSVSAVTFFSSPFDTVRTYLNQLEGIDGFIYQNYTEGGTSHLAIPRKYFTIENGRRIDAVRTSIENWHTHGLLTEEEYFVLLAALIESVPFYANISGVYAAFLKTYDPRALKQLQIKPIAFYSSTEQHQVHNVNSSELVDGLEVDVLYLDPPYNQRQYAPNYHLLETIARYDTPEIKGVSGMRPYLNQKSVFCNKDSALLELDRIARDARYKSLILSYNTEGIMPTAAILKTLEKYGTVELRNHDYLRFKSNGKNDLSRKKTIQEQLFILRR